MLKRIGHAVGAVIGVLGIAFVVRELADNREDALAAVSEADPVLLGAALLVGLASMTTIGLAWRRCLAILDVDRPRLDTLRRYFVGQLGKYVPGGIWPVIGRAEMARRGGVTGTVAYGSTVLSLGLTYLAAILTAVGALVAGGLGAGETYWLPVLVLLPLGVVALHPSVVGGVLAGLRRVSRRPLEIPVPAWPVSITLLLRHVPAWLGIGAATWLVATALEGGGVDFRNLLLATTLSWVVGFLAVGVPGGIGVREAVFVATATSLSSTGVAAAVALASRVAFILVDVSGAGLTTLAAGRELRRRARQRNGFLT